jgi:hypothetical protein
MTASGPGGVLALDLSTRSGWCYGRLDDTHPVSGVWVLPPMSRLGECFVALDNELSDAIALHQPRLVLTEAPLEKAQHTARLLMGLADHALSCCYRHSVPCREQSVNTMRLAVLGRAHFADRDPRTGKRVNGSVNAKAAVLAWCREQGWTDVFDDNEADARLCWTYAVREMRRRRSARQ